MANPTPADRLTLAACPYIEGVCRVPASDCRHRCRRDAAAAVRELAEQAGSAKHWHVDQLSAIAAELEVLHG
jgi:hypothetical protein